MEQQKRLLVAIGASLALTLVFTQFIWKPELEKEQVRLAALDAGTPAEVKVAQADPVAAVVPAPAAAPVPMLDADGGVLLDADGGVVYAPAAAPTMQAEVLPQRTIEVARAAMKLAFTTEGASLTDAVLLGEREKVMPDISFADGLKKLFGTQYAPRAQMDLAEPPAMGPGHLGLAISGASPLEPRVRYQVTEEAKDSITFQAAQGPWKVEKRFTFAPEGYRMTLDVSVTNTSANTAEGKLEVYTARAIDPGAEQAPSFLGGIGNQSSVLCRHDDKVERKQPDPEEPKVEQTGKLSFVAIDQQYFLSAVFPLQGEVDGACNLFANEVLRTAALVQPLSVKPGETMKTSFGVYLGPKDIDLLKELAPGAALNPALDDSIDFSWWAVICKGLLFFMRFFHNLTGNWGVAIILLTVMVKVLLLPLTHKSLVSAEQMKKLQPKMEEIKKKYADDREKQNAETMKLYQEAKVNPLGGCLPMLVQMPIWIALFTTLRTSYELYGMPFYGPVWTDLTSKDPTYILPLALGITMVLTQRLQPQMMDAMQAKIMTWGMPIFFTAIMLSYPAGLALYIFTNNLLSIAQQFFLRRWMERTGQLEPRKAKPA